MSLVICQECGKEYSDMAASCPNCGCPTKLQVTVELKEFDQPEGNVVPAESEQEANVNPTSQKPKSGSMRLTIILSAIAGVLLLSSLSGLFDYGKLHFSAASVGSFVGGLFWPGLGFAISYGGKRNLQRAINVFAIVTIVTYSIHMVITII